MTTNICRCGNLGVKTLIISSRAPYPGELERRPICDSCAKDFEKEMEKKELYWEDLKAGRIDILGNPL